MGPAALRYLGRKLSQLTGGARLVEPSPIRAASTAPGPQLRTVRQYAARITSSRNGLAVAAVGLWRRCIGVPAVIFVLAVACSFWLYIVVDDAVESVARLRFERQASDIRHAIGSRIHSYADVMYGLQALLASQPHVSRVQFRRYVESLDLKSRYPGYDVVNYAVRVLPEEKQRFEASVRADSSTAPEGYPHFAIKPPGDRPEYFVIVYVEPMAGFEFAFGLDLGANPAVDGADSSTLRALQHSARDSGLVTASGRPIRIKTRGKEYTGLALRLAVYRGGMSLATIEDRRAAYLGSVGAGLNVQELMKGVIDSMAAHDVEFKVYDIGSVDEAPEKSAVSEERLLFSSGQLESPPRADVDLTSEHTYFSNSLPLTVGGRTWEVTFSAKKDSMFEGIDGYIPGAILAGGLFSSVLLFGMFYSVASSRSRAVAMANVMTEDLRNSTEQLQALSRRHVDVQESERRRFSRELHDQVGQNLTALSINLDILKSQLPRGNDALHSRLEDAGTLLESTAATIENVMAELRPPMLDDYGLLPALQWYANDFVRRTGIEVAVRGSETGVRLAQSSEIALFRIVQEALNNVAKHAHASQVSITLEHAGEHVIMIIADDGVGYGAATSSAARRRSGLGMVTMRERTQAVGGQFEIGPAADGGTRISVRVPC
jgi:signal transduction histidine kinase